MDNKAKYALALGAFIIITLIGYVCMPKNETEIQINRNEEEKYIYVHVEGCINNPGLIKAREGSRLYELIELAGRRN